MFDSVERITKENGTIVSVFVLTVRREYIKNSKQNLPFLMMMIYPKFLLI